jgi:hypothetical protein
VLLGVGALVATIASHNPATAADEEEPIRLTYQASTSCPTESEFVTRIRARTTRARVAWPGENARTFDVLIDAGPPPSGRVTILDADIPTGTRRVTADACPQVADALALVIALSVDPHASPPPEVAPKPPPGTAPDPLALEPSIQQPTDKPPRASPSADERRGLFVGVDFAVTYGVAPAALLSSAPYLGWRSSAEGILRPALRFTFVHATDSGQPAPSGSADFAWTVGRVDLCPADWSWSSFGVTACARIEGGALAVVPYGVELPEKRVRPWFAAGLLARAEWSFLRPLFLDADLDVLLRATDDRFYFVPDTTFYRVPVVGGSGGIGLGAHFL